MSAIAEIGGARLRRRLRQGADGWRALDWVCAVFIALLLLLVLFGPLLAPQDPDAVNITAANAGPSSAHLLGTDAVGRDLLSRLIVGARTSVVGPVVVALLMTAGGTVLGIVAGWRGGWTDQSISAVSNAALAFPGLLLAILAVAVFGRGLVAPVIALSLSYTPYVVRVVRAAVMRERRLPYVEALQAQGFASISIAGRHVLPAISPLLIAQGTIGFGYAMVDLAAISFLGLGVQPPAADWGAMVAAGQTLILDGKPEQSLYAGALIVMTVMAVTIFGERLSARAEARR